MLVRAAIIAACAVAIAVLAMQRSDHDACMAALASITRAAYGGAAPAAGLASEARLVTERCDDGTDAASASGALSTGRRRSPALALELAATAARREPEGFNAWVALELARAGVGDLTGARAAERRAKALNPRWPGLPPSAASGRWASG